MEHSDSPGPSTIPDVVGYLTGRKGFIYLLAAGQVVERISSGGKDLERSTTVTTPAIDPYNLRSKLKTNDELASLRQRKNARQGKQLEKYHRKQNDVCGLVIAIRPAF